MSWTETTFKEFVTLQRGFDLPASQMKEGDIPVLGSTNIIGYHNEAKANPPGVITGRSGTIGKLQFVDKPYWPHNTSLWVKDFKSNYPKFVYYKMQTIDFERFNGGASVPTLNRNNLDNLAIIVPSLPTQIVLADFLSHYDSLIENNLRRIELLENAARLIYKEWFVKLNFPGREHTKIVDGMPEGWHMGTVGELASVQSGYAFKSLDWQTDGNPVIKIKNIDNNTIDIINCDCVPDMIAEKAIKFKLSAGDLLIAMTGATIGKIGIMPRTNQPYYLNQRVGLFKSKHESIDIIPFLFVLFNTENAQSQIVNFAAGAAQPNISGGQIEAVKTIISPDKILKMFSEYVVPILNQREILAAQNEQLKKARDILLPKLMTGEIAV
jgi:type I restriction enzyme S subunit